MDSQLHTHEIAPFRNEERPSCELGQRIRRISNTLDGSNPNVAFLSMKLHEETEALGGTRRAMVASDTGPTKPHISARGPRTEVRLNWVNSTSK